MKNFTKIIVLVFLLFCTGQVCFGQKPIIASADDISYSVNGNEVKGVILWEKGSEMKGYVILQYDQDYVMQKFLIKDPDMGDMICSNPVSLPDQKPLPQYVPDKFSLVVMSGSLFYMDGEERISVERNVLISGDPMNKDPMDMTRLSGRIGDAVSLFDFQKE